jgi:hypothetical protein
MYNDFKTKEDRLEKREKKNWFMFYFYSSISIIFLVMIVDIVLTIKLNNL